LIEAKTYRWFGHAINNPASAIGRPEAEILAWKARDPIPHFERQLIEAGLASTGTIEALHTECAEELEASISFAEASPAPPVEDALTDVYTVLPAGARL
jgi:TPP-dependent pyruvate/acetoin dehydrogenase alpha subunit